MSEYPAELFIELSLDGETMLGGAWKAFSIPEKPFPNCTTNV